MIIKIGILIVINLILLFKTIWYGKCLDDISVKVRKASNPIKHIWWIFKGRAANETSYLSRIFSILCQIINSILILYVFGQMPKIAFLTALLWTINPAINHSACWMNARRYQVSTMLILIGFCIPKLFGLFYLMTPYWQINALLSPILWIGTKYWFWSLLPLLALLMIDLSTQRKGWRRLKLINWFIARRKHIANGELLRLRPMKFVVVCKTYAYYLRLALFPNKISIYYNFLHVFGMHPDEDKLAYKLDKWFWIGLISYLGTIAAIICLWGSPISFGLLWFFILIKNWENWITVHQPIGLRYLYLCSIGLFYALSNVLYLLPTNYRLIAITAFITHYLIYHFHSLWQYKDIHMQLDHGLTVSPGHVKATFMKWIILMQCNDINYAFILARAAITIRPKNFKCNWLMANTLVPTRQFDLARKHIKVCVDNLIPGKEEELLDDCKKITREIKAMEEKFGGIVKQAPCDFKIRGTRFKKGRNKRKK